MHVLHSAGLFLGLILGAPPSLAAARVVNDVGAGVRMAWAAGLTGSSSGGPDLRFPATGGSALAPDRPCSGFFADDRFHADERSSLQTPGPGTVLPGSSPPACVLAGVEIPSASNAWSAAPMADATSGPILDGSGATLDRFCFDIVSSQRNAMVYRQWVETCLLEGGEPINLRAASAPTALAQCLGGMASLGFFRRRSRRIVTQCAWCSGEISGRARRTGPPAAEQSVSHGICRSCLELRVRTLGTGAPDLAPDLRATTSSFA